MLTLNEMMASLGSASKATEQSAKDAASAVLLGGFTSISDFEVQLHLVSDLPEHTELPRYQFDLHIKDWGFTSNTGTATLTQTTPEIEFDHPQFELVSFVRDFLGSALTRLAIAFRSVDGVVDFLNSVAFPLISLIFGRTSYVSAGSTIDGGKVEIGNFAGAARAIHHIVEGGTIVGTPGVLEIGQFGVIPFDLIPNSKTNDSLSSVDPIGLLTGSAWINVGDLTQLDFTVDGVQARLPLPRGVTNLPPQKVHSRPFGKPDDAPGVSILGDIRNSVPPHAARSEVPTASLRPVHVPGPPRSPLREQLGRTSHSPGRNHPQKQLRQPQPTRGRHPGHLDERVLHVEEARP